MARVVQEYGEYYLIVNKEEANEIRQMERFIPVTEMDPLREEYIGTFFGIYVIVE